jgi:hypothetical protein
LLLAATSALCAGAHGTAEHGGAFNEVEEYTFELVGKRTEGESAQVSLYIKAPGLKPVTTGKVSLQIVEQEGKTRSIELTPKADKAFHGEANFPRHGRYRTTAVLVLAGQKPLKCSLSLLLP